MQRKLFSVLNANHFTLLKMENNTEAMGFLVKIVVVILQNLKIQFSVMLKKDIFL